ncbi:MAG: hypothetical protein KGD64_12735 [Candidatus Heimdallarchaeota archaeon]|nr:hypothetical protein [Candidatus Heimdallarchaeota archaeon]
MSANNNTNRWNKYLVKARNYREYAFFGALTLAIYFTSFYHNLLFHSLIELIGFMITYAIFLVFWNSKDAIDNQFFTLLGISFFFIGAIDLLHTLTYEGMGIFTGFDYNLSTQLWIVGRSLQAVTLLLAVLLMEIKMRPYVVMLILGTITISLLALVFTGNFPVCYIAGYGLTTFKKVAEIIICLIYASSIILLFLKRSKFGSVIYYFIIAAVSLSIIGEVFFSLYFVYTDVLNLLGNIARFISIYFFYRATVHVGLKNPLALLFQNLQNQQTRRLQSLVENLPEGVLLLDEEYKIIIKNPSADEFLPFLVKENKKNSILNIANYPIHEILSPSSSDLVYYELKIVNPEERVFHFGGVKISDGPQKGDSIIIIHDITTENKMRARVQTQEKLASVGKLSRGISHDFKNIIWTISGAAELIEAQSKDENLKNLGSLISQQAAKGTELINQILDFSGQSEATTEIINVKPLIEQTSKLARPSLPHNVSIETSLENFKIKMNKIQMHQILLNLIVNSKDALKGGGLIQISTEKVKSNMVKDFELDDIPIPTNFYVRLRVEDNGDGIKRDEINKIFDPFFTTKPAGEGSGLGLSQVYGIARQHGGYINVESKEGEWTKIDLFFPLYDDKL